MLAPVALAFVCVFVFARVFECERLGQKLGPEPKLHLNVGPKLGLGLMLMQRATVSWGVLHAQLLYLRFCWMKMNWTPLC